MFYYLKFLSNLEMCMPVFKALIVLCRRSGKTGEKGGGQ